ncbi:MAG: AAA family ATPase, partial [Planctomycetaceae bacterium]
MDTRQFSLTRPPFAATPQPSCCFPHEKWQHTLDELVVRLRAGQGTCVLTGQAGLGKTLALKVVAHELHREFCILSLPAPGVLDTLGLQQCLLAELEVGRIEGGPTELRLALVHELRGLIRNGRPGVILLDEAQTVAAPLLEELRTLAIQDEGGEPLARILVAGQPAFEETLAGPGFEAFNQQVACHKVLEPLGLTESVEYILHRVAWAGGDPESLFCIEALDAVVRAAGGNPRLINRACDLALLLAAAREQPAVDAESMQLALDDLQKLALPWQPTARDSRAADDSQFAATNPAAWPGIALDADVTGWEEPDQSLADVTANWSSAQGVGLDASRGQQPSEGVDDNSADHAGSRPGDGLRDESRADREGDDFAEPTWPTGVAGLRDEGRHAEGLFGPRAKSSNPAASNPAASEPPADRRRASASSVGAEPSALSPELPTRGSSPAWQPVVPAEKPIQPGQDPFEGFDPVPATLGDSDPSGEYRWLLPGASGGAPISAGDRSSRRVTGADELAGGQTAGPS